MGFENYISESEAANFAGVSVATLNRFAEAGYLEIETESDGLRLFSTRELGEVFGIKQDGFSTRKSFGHSESKLRSRQQIRTVEPLDNDEETEDASQLLSKQSSPQEDTSSYYSSVSPEQESFSVDAEPQELTSRMASFISSSLAAKHAERISNTPRSTYGALFEEIITPESKATSANAHPAGTSIVLEQEQRITTLERVVEMQEKILDMRESEIESLKKERDWLRSRIERLEEKGDRDQLLLLSETQVIRQLVTAQKRSSSPIRAALEWFGLVEPQKDTPMTGQAIEMKRK
ncbi:MAG: hypothetical protein KDD55_09875 [Bdellovibrionales bacterium]|nr:hypothetical protein [Bdellovibrionales bacterium]